jgi:hypothetical protein
LQIVRLPGILFRFPKKPLVRPSPLSIDDNDLKFVSPTGTTQIKASIDLQNLVDNEGSHGQPHAVVLRIRSRARNLAGHPGGQALEGEQCPPKAVLHRPLCFARLGFHGLGGGKFPISVWLGARGTRVQLTSLLVGCTTSRTRYGQYLFQGVVFGFHRDSLQSSTAGKLSPFGQIRATAAWFHWSVADVTIVSKSEHLW